MRRNRAFALNIFAGLAGGLAAAWAMEQFQKRLAAVSEDLGGADGGGGQQHRQPQSEPATYKAADVMSRALTGRSLVKRDKPIGGALVHYAFGGAVGAMYGAAAARNSGVGAGAGVPFGAALWLVADEMGVPLAGLAKAPTEYPLSDHASALGAHLVYGVTTELIRRGIVTLAS